MFFILNIPGEGASIRINTDEYRRWKVRQNKKNLRRRTRKKKIARDKCTAIIASRRLLQRNRVTFQAPEFFSFTEDPEGTTSFFGKLINFITDKRNFGKALFIDLSQINVLTIDSLMYLLAVVNNLNKDFKSKYIFQGNYPRNPQACTLIKNSGFYRYVRSNVNEPIVRNANNFQIVSGDRVATEMAKRLCDFVIEKANVPRSTCRFLYMIMIELMANVYSHAYTGNKGVLFSRWYCFAEYNERDQRFSFTFMDTGEGIPSTVRKHGLEHVDFLNIRGDNLYVCSALKGQLRSKTKKPYRGKGLPFIYETCKKKKILDMRIITDNADVTIHNGEFVARDLIHSLQGTLFYWQIDMKELIEVA